MKAILILMMNLKRFQKNQIKIIIDLIRAQILFDAVAGERTGQLLQFLPKGSTAYVYVYVYGLLSGTSNIIANFFDLALNKMTVRGYAMTEFFEELPNLFQDIEFHKKLNQLIRRELKT